MKKDRNSWLITAITVLLIPQVVCVGSALRVVSGPGKQTNKQTMFSLLSGPDKQTNKQPMFTADSQPNSNAKTNAQVTNGQSELSTDSGFSLADMMMADSPFDGVMVNDSPFSGVVGDDGPSYLEQPLTLEQLDQLRKNDRDSMLLAYRSDPLVQLHNKGSSLNLAISRDGVITLQDNTDSLSSIFRQSLVWGSEKLVTMTSMIHCYKLCVNHKGRVYTQDFSSDSSECNFSTVGSDWNGITDHSKLVSPVHSNSTHKMYLSLLDFKTNRLAGVRLSEEELKQKSGYESEHMRDWVVLTVNETEVETHSNTFRRKGVSVNELTNRRSWAHNYCEAKVLHRSNQRKKVEKYCDKHKIQDFKVCKTEYKCLNARKQKKSLANQDLSISKGMSTCTQSERDARYGRGWPWNTRNCSALPKLEMKECKRTKRSHCVKKQRGAGRSRSEARRRCGAGAKKRYKRCLVKLKDMPPQSAKRKCKSREQRYLSSHRKNI